VDLSSLSSVRSAAQAILSDSSIPHIDVMINNAAIMACPYTLSADDFELQLATNHLSHFLLTNLLLPKLLPSGPNTYTRIINVSSWGHAFSPFRTQDPNFTSGDYLPWTAYGQAKTANILFSVGLNQRFKGRGLRAFALHPGSIATNLQRYTDPDMVRVAMDYWKEIGKEMPARKTLQQGCATTLRAALDPSLEEREEVYLQDCQLSEDPEVVKPYAVDAENARVCWEMSEQMVGERFDIGK